MSLESIEVTARFDLQGQVYPLSLLWKGQVYPVETTGRRWQAPTGLHILVLTANGLAFELCFNASEGRWYMVQSSTDRLLA